MQKITILSLVMVATLFAQEKDIFGVVIPTQEKSQKTISQKHKTTPPTPAPQPEIQLPKVEPIGEIEEFSSPKGKISASASFSEKKSLALSIVDGDISFLKAKRDCILMSNSEKELSRCYSR